MRIRHRSISAAWPFWLTVAAWFCANVPPTATAQLFTWIKGTEHFSHYADLRQSVASLLSGKRDPASAQLTHARSAHQSLPPALPPAGVEVKKIDFATATGSLRLIASLPESVRPVLEIHAPADPVVEVPYPPPRVRELA